MDKERRKLHSKAEVLLNQSLAIYHHKNKNNNNNTQGIEERHETNPINNSDSIEFTLKKKQVLLRTAKHQAFLEEIQQVESLDLVSNMSRSLSINKDDAHLTLTDDPHSDTTTISTVQKLLLKRRVRHYESLKEYETHIDAIHEDIEAQLFLLTSQFKSDVENTDKLLQRIYTVLEDPIFVLDCSEPDPRQSNSTQKLSGVIHEFPIMIPDLLQHIKGIVEKRSDMIRVLESSYVQLEETRSTRIHRELTKTVNTLISIAFLLPQDIEKKVIEKEAYQLNTLLITNQQEHIKLVGEFQKLQIQQEILSTQHWEMFIIRWRQLQHQGSLTNFHSLLTSSLVTQPSERQEIITIYTQHIQQYEQQRLELLTKLTSCQYNTLNSTSIQEIRNELMTLMYKEINEGVLFSRSLKQAHVHLLVDLQQYTEEFRYILHFYGALHDKPPLLSLASEIDHMLTASTTTTTTITSTHTSTRPSTHPSTTPATSIMSASTSMPSVDLSELWRIGGSLKSDFENTSRLFQSRGVMYESSLKHIESKITLIQASLPLGDIFEKRGRTSQLQRIQQLIIRLRSASRKNVLLLVESLLPDLLDIQQIEELSEDVKYVLSEVTEDMSQTMTNIAVILASTSTNSMSSIDGGGEDKDGRHIGSLSQLSFTKSTLDSPRVKSASISLSSPYNNKGGGRKSIVNIDNINDNKQRQAQEGGSSRASMRGSRQSTSMSNRSRLGMGSDYEKEQTANIFIDLQKVKHWGQMLGVVLFSSQIPSIYHDLITHILQAIKQQFICNSKVDSLVDHESSMEIVAIDLQYKSSIHEIETYLEGIMTQFSSYNDNICAFYYKCAKEKEQHDSSLFALSEHNKDELFDCGENNRLILLDLEDEFEQKCQQIKTCAVIEYLPKLFDEAVLVLRRIEDEYRQYHSLACLAADKGCLAITNHYCSHVEAMSALFGLHPQLPNSILAEYNKVLERTKRLNKGSSALESQLKQLRSAYTLASSQQPSLSSMQTTTNANKNTASSTRTSAATVPASTGGTANNQNKSKNKAQPTSTSTVNATTVSTNNTTAVNTSPTSPNEMIKTSTGSVYTTTTALSAIIQSFFQEVDFDSTTAITSTIVPPVMTDAVTNASQNTSTIVPPVMTDAVTNASQNTSTATTVSVSVTPPTPILRPWYRTPVLILSLQQIEQLTQIIVSIPKLYYQSLALVFKPLSEVEIASFNDIMRAEYTTALTNSTQNIKLANTSASTITIVPPPPCDPFNQQPIIQYHDIDNTLISQNLQLLRDDILLIIEKNCIETSVLDESEAGMTKDNLTRQLEDRLRQHWPRQGRCETEMKAVRSAELLSHEEKIYRFIQTAQTRFGILVSKVRTAFQSAEQEFFKYEGVVAGYISSMQDPIAVASHTSIAPYQVLDAAVRKINIEFYKSNDAQLLQLNKLIGSESFEIISYLKDYVKYHPPQITNAGTGSAFSGGFSYSELAEIGVMVEGQLQEIQSETTKWQEELEALKTRQQQQSVQLTTEFSRLYDLSVLSLSIQHGLGSIYGVPRRNALEKLRHVDMINTHASMELDNAITSFINKCRQLSSISISTTTLMTDMNKLSTTKDDVIVCWNDLKYILTLVQSRAKFLDIIQKSPLRTDVHTCTWLGDTLVQALGAITTSTSTDKKKPGHLDKKASSKKSLQPTSPTGTTSTNPGTTTGATTSGNINNYISMVKNIEVECRKESLELYQKSINNNPALAQYLLQLQSTTASMNTNNGTSSNSSSPTLVVSTSGKGGGVSSSSKSGANNKSTLPVSSIVSSGSEHKVLFESLLDNWLSNISSKMLGVGGTHEEAWTHIYSQMNQIDKILGRQSTTLTTLAVNTSSADDDNNIPDSLHFPTLCFQTIYTNFIHHLRLKLQNNYKKLAEEQLNQDKNKEIYTRQLRPSLRSPDMTEILATLNKQVHDTSLKSIEIFEHMHYETTLFILNSSKQYIEDILLMYRGCMQIVECFDSNCLTRPNNCISNNSNTSLSNDDIVSKEYIWPNVLLDSYYEICHKYEFASLPSKLRTVTSVPTPTTNNSTKALKTKSTATTTPTPAVVNTESTFVSTIYTSQWKSDIATISSIKSFDSIVYEKIVQLRDTNIRLFQGEIEHILADNAVKFGSILEREVSWKKHWDMQVDMLLHH